MGVTPLSNFHQLIDDMLGCRAFWITHTKVNNILATGSGFGFQIIDDVKNIRW
jgi:hypothetical protein